VHVYVDESIRPGPAGLYVLAAAVVDGEDLAETAEQLRRLLPRRRIRFHWHAEDEPLRLRMVAALAAAPIGFTAYQIGLSSNSGRALDRARAQLVGRLLWDLRDAGDVELVFESRQARNDRRDATVVAHARRAGWLGLQLRYRFGRPGTDPMLWAADAVAGAVVAHLDGRSRYLEALPADRVALIALDP
jgi:hypothetical protein